MRICLICGEIFAWGKYGGFGRACRTIGRELVKRGVEVVAVVPRRGDQGAEETLDGMKVLGFRKYDMAAAFRLYRRCNADVYHSQEPSLGTWLAMCAAPEKIHVATCRDPRTPDDWRVEEEFPSRHRVVTRLSHLYEYNALVRRALQKADAVFCAAPCLSQKAQALYGLAAPPVFLPTPVRVPDQVRKAAQPTVCYLGRMDRRKRPDLFLALARDFPRVRFVAIGTSQDMDWFRPICEPYRRQPNLELLGFIDQFSDSRISRILSESWVMVNTALREGLPNAFLEAAAHGCSILSRVNPDGFASQFGFHAATDNFADGLRFLLEHNRWIAQGQKARSYVHEQFEISRAMDRHMAAYERLLGTPTGSGSRCP